MGKLKGKVTEKASPSTGTVQQQGGGNPTYPYNQPYGDQLGLARDSAVNFDVVDVPQRGKTAVSVILQSATQVVGTVTAINTDNQTGNMTYEGATIRFDQPYANLLGIKVGSSVDFTPIDLGNGQTMGVALSIPAKGGNGKDRSGKK